MQTLAHSFVVNNSLTTERLWGVDIPQAFDTEVIAVIAPWCRRLWLTASCVGGTCRLKLWRNRCRFRKIRRRWVTWRLSLRSPAASWRGCRKLWKTWSSGRSNSSKRVSKHTQTCQGCVVLTKGIVRRLKLSDVRRNFAWMSFHVLRFVLTLQYVQNNKIQ